MPGQDDNALSMLHRGDVKSQVNAQIEQKLKTGLAALERRQDEIIQKRIDEAVAAARADERVTVRNKTLEEAAVLMEKINDETCNDCLCFLYAAERIIELKLKLPEAPPVEPSEGGGGVGPVS